ncbi:GNAT family N-acetyltransferase [Taibaiella helva]|uniref:GNAT family N-acetyltransferase n=1 Tax=Taibaiella helva TaxID=2301235 RepID=UPI000E5954CF|nr:GNAT family N-acetyltransferase [Taibaiella helva]
MFTISTPTVAAYPQLLFLWEASVRATHHFLKEEDILFYKQQLATVYFPQVQLSCAYSGQGDLLGFSGVAGNNLEMLFVSPDARGKGVGRLLLEHAIREQGVSKVDVNEQNGQALGFYEHAGFKITGRSEYDGQGKPYPILHLAL